jgi:hypothetical protein
MNVPGAKLTFTAAKAKVAAVWATLAAIQVFLGLVMTVLDDDKVGADEVTPLITGIISMGIGVWRVWATPNDLVRNDSGSSSRV